MRVHPAITEEEAMGWLLARATSAMDIRATEEEMAAELKPFAAAMAALSAVVMPDEVEPLFP